MRGHEAKDGIGGAFDGAWRAQALADFGQAAAKSLAGGLVLQQTKRFVSDTWRSYQRNQLDVIRANVDKSQFITTNMMGWFDGFDHYTVSQDLDLAAWDDYVKQGVLWGGTDDALSQLTRDGGGGWSNVTPHDMPAWSTISMIEPSRFDASGLRVHRSPGVRDALPIFLVVPGTPAAEAGLRESDLLLAVDGVPAERLSPGVIAERLWTCLPQALQNRVRSSPVMRSQSAGHGAGIVMM